MSETRKPAPPFAVVIFGANGDLTRRLIVPAFYNLARTGLLPDRFAIVGVDHNKRTAEDWNRGLRDFVDQSAGSLVDENCWRRIGQALSYVQGDFLSPDTYRNLAAHLKERNDKEELGGNVLFYLAVADRFFAPIVEHLGRAKLVSDGDNGGRRHVIVEKPFGHDLESARSLNRCLLEWLREDQIYRIDHFLGKETVQNILAMRFANGLFEPIWHRDRIDQIQITVAETLGVETRGSFYEKTGALRDMIPNHLFQLVAMTAMEPPTSFDADEIRSKKAEVFKAVHPIKAMDACRGQYGEGRVQGKPALAYRSEKNVAPNSNTETYVGLRLMIDNWRWAGVPFYLRTGKRLSKRSTEIAIRFKPAPYALFRDTPVDGLDADWLILKIQPDEGIRLRFNAKQPGPTMTIESVAMDFRYADWFKQAPSVGYETLLYDCMIGDATLFQRADQVEAAWALVDPVLQAWQSPLPTSFPDYAAGSAGPSCADELLARDGHVWRAIT